MAFPLWPAWRYGPNQPEDRAIFQSPDEVPEGWTNNPADHTGPAPKAPAASPAAVPLTRKQVIAELNLRKLPYEANAPTAALYELLVAAIYATEA
jgi:hypothetical protein